MEAEERAEDQAGDHAEGGSERRIDPRSSVDEGAILLIVNHGRCIAGQIMDLSVSGCRLGTMYPFTAGIKTQVEIAFRIHGIRFRLSGVVQWARARQLGVRFVDVPARRQIELFDVLLEREADLAAKAAKESAKAIQAKPLNELRSGDGEKRGQAWAHSEKTAQPSADFARPGSSLADAVRPEMDSGPQTVPEALPAPASGLPLSSQDSQQDSQQAANPSGRDRRSQARVPIDTSADILLINIGSHVAGRIQDLSAGGCRIHTGEPFPVGIYTRVETEFRLQGLPFRLSGVIQALYDQKRQVVGIRFLDMSSRKRDQVEQLIKEMEEERQEQSEL